jgi:hypothetical protein
VPEPSVFEFELPIEKLKITNRFNVMIFVSWLKICGSMKNERKTISKHPRELIYRLFVRR